MSPRMTAVARLKVASSGVSASRRSARPGRPLMLASQNASAFWVRSSARVSTSSFSLAQLGKPYSRAIASCATARVDGRSETPRRRRVASASPLLAARSNSFAWWRSWSRFGFGGNVGMTSPWLAGGPRTGPRRRTPRSRSALQRGGLSPARGPGGALSRLPGDYRDRSVRQGQRLVLRRPSCITTVAPSCKRIRIPRQSGRSLTRRCGLGPAAPQGLDAGRIWKVAP